jgi:chromosome segregation ATPase
MPVDHALDVAGLLIDLRQQDYDDGEALTHRPALPTPSPKSSSIADLAQAVKAHGCGYETSDSQLKRRATDGEEEVSSIEEKHLKRMRRNRESAAMSRSRKKCYIEELEAKVAKLTETVNALQSENITLQHERAKLQQSRTTAGQDMHAPPPPLKAEFA